MDNTSNATPSFDPSRESAMRYDEFLGPMFFEPYSIEVAKRIDPSSISLVLEIAAGTGRVTRHTSRSAAQKYFEGPLPESYNLATSMNDEAIIRPLLEDAGFSKISIEKVQKNSVCTTTKEAAINCQPNPTQPLGLPNNKKQQMNVSIRQNLYASSLIVQFRKLRSCPNRTIILPNLI